MSIKIWLGDLGKYNAGNLVGEWLELPMDSDDLQAKINQYSRDGQGDYFIADHECDIDGLVGEYSNPHKLNELAETLDGMGDHDTARVSFLISYHGYSASDALEKYEDVDFYEGMTLKDLAEHLVDVGCFGEIPEHLANYIDYDAIARDLGCDYVETKEGCFRHD